MRRFKAFMAVFAVCMVVLSFVCVSAESITVFIDGAEADAEPYMKGDRVMVPVRRIFELLGAAVEWEDSTQRITAVKDDITAQFTIDSNLMYKNGAETYIDTAPELVGDRTFVPLRAVSEVFGYAVHWADSEQRVDIQTRGAEYYDAAASVPDFGACLGIEPATVVGGNIYMYDVSAMPSDFEERYEDIMTAAGFLKADGGAYTVFSRGNDIVLAGIADGMYRVVITTY